MMMCCVVIFISLPKALFPPNKIAWLSFWYYAYIDVSFAALEDAKAGLELERTRLQTQVRDLERQQLETSHQLQSAQEELQRSHAATAQIQNEEKELQARLITETEERERAQQELHQLKKQVRNCFIFCILFTKAWSDCSLIHIFTAYVSKICI
jgi:septal ring factor EnvC (AmiA/AmiB activator)